VGRVSGVFAENLRGAALPENQIIPIATACTDHHELQHVLFAIGV
jgi:hypothetical protein